MKPKQIISWTLLLSLLLMLGGCYATRIIGPERLNQQALENKKAYWINGVYLIDGTYLQFVTDTLSYPGYNASLIELAMTPAGDRLPLVFERPVLIGDTLYGTLLSKWVAIPTDDFKQSDLQMASDGYGSYWINGVYLKDGTYLPFEMSSPTLRARFGLPISHKGPVVANDTLYGALLSSERVAISVDKISKYHIHKFDAAGTWITVGANAFIIYLFAKYADPLPGLFE